MNRKEKTAMKKLIALVLTLMFTLTAVAALALIALALGGRTRRAEPSS